MSDVECPYCGHEQEVDYCDGHGCEEGESYEEYCEECEKTFLFNTSISFSHESRKADCLNGAEHIMKTPATTLIDIFPDIKRCVGCGLEVRGRYVPENRGK